MSKQTDYSKISKEKREPIQHFMMDEQFNKQDKHGIVSTELTKPYIETKVDPGPIEIEIIEKPVYKTYIVAMKRLNVREKPSKEANKVGLLHHFEKVTITRLTEDGKWGACVGIDSNVTGYVMMKYLTPVFKTK